VTTPNLLTGSCPGSVEPGGPAAAPGRGDRRGGRV